MARAYRFARRAFLAGTGGALGLRILLRDLEAAAEGAVSPARFVLAHWPQGTLKYRFQPTGAGSAYTASPIIQPFEDAGLRGDMTVFWGFSDGHLSSPGGGGREAGTVFTTTGCSSPGTRMNSGEQDDAVAGGPSFDQVFLKRVAGLSRPLPGFVNAICDSRVDSFETSTQCLSYGYEKRSISSAQPGGSIEEHLPLLPTLEPAKLYAQLFAEFMPGGATPANQEAALVALQLRKSVLDHALGELTQLKRLAPSAEGPKIELHAQAIRELELELQDAGQNVGVCTTPVSPAAGLSGKSGNVSYEAPTENDTERHRSVAEAHLAVLTAAMACDIVRVATFQFTPGTNHVCFGGLWPGDAERLSTQYEVIRSGLILTGGAAEPPDGLSELEREQYEFLANVQTWYNQLLAKWLQRMKASTDVFGGALLDTTLVPFVTEVAQGNSSRHPKPAFLFGGAKLGLQHGTYQNFSQSRPQVDLFMTCAQALLQTADPAPMLADEPFLQFNPTAAPVAGLWTSV
jgi:hypothetical protein